MAREPLPLQEDSSVTGLRPSKSRIFCYGMAEWGSNAVETFYRINLLIYSTDILALSPGIAGLIVAIGVVWDGVTDPVVGRLSDNLKSSWGRRIPFIVLGAILLPLSIILMFLIAPGTSYLTFKIGAVYLLSNTALTLISVPHAALAGDLSQERQTRTQIFAVRYFYSIAGLMTGIALPGYYLQSQGNNYDSYVTAAWGIAAIVLLSSLVTIFAGKKYDDPSGEQEVAEGKVSYRSLATNKPFFILVLAYLAATIGQSINSSLALYYYRYRLELNEQDIQLILVVFTLVISFSLPAWYRASYSFDKVKLLSIATILLGAIGSVVYPLFTPGVVSPVMVMAVVGGVLVGSVFLLEVILADVVDSVSHGANLKSYGIYFGVWKLSAKISRAVAIGLSGVLLEGIGFVGGAENQASETILGLGYLFGPGVGIFFVLGGLVILKLPRLQNESDSQLKV